MQKLIDSAKLDSGSLILVHNIVKLCSDKQNNLSSIYRSNEYLNSILTKCGYDIDDIQEDNDIFTVAKGDSTLSAKIKSFQNKYQESITHIFQKQLLQKQKDYLAGILGTDKGLVFDLLTTQSFARKMEEMNPLTNEELFEITTLNNPFYAQYLTKKNNELLALIESNKNKKAYNVYELPETEDDNILHEIAKPFEGKVIMIDFWATWCGPCRSAMKEFEPVKNSFADKDVVFVYLTDESSPLKAWENMIPTIEGEHYRIKTSQFEYLKEKFGASGIPAYMILNKKGEQVYFKVGFDGDTINKKLNEELAKEF